MFPDGTEKTAGLEREVVWVLGQPVEDSGQDPKRAELYLLESKRRRDARETYMASANKLMLFDSVVKDFQLSVYFLTDDFNDFIDIFICEFYGR